MVEEVLGKEYAGQIVCDGWKGYLGWVLQRGWAHLLRYAKMGAEESEEGKALYATLCEVYHQMTRGLATASPRARARRLTMGGKALTVLSEKGKTWSEGKLHAAIEEVVGEWSESVKVRVRRGGATPRIGWSFRDRAVRVAARRDGKYVLLCTDPRLSAAEVVEQYLGKDFVEKAFRTLKAGIEVEPVRHRRERRVRAYLFVCGLAYRLEMALRWKLLEGGVKPEDVAEYQERLLEELGRVERTEVRLGAQSRTWYLNVTERVREGLRRLKALELLAEGPTIAPPLPT